MKSRTPLLLFALLGLGASLTSTYVHYRLLTNPTYASFCDVNSTVSCTQAYLSPYGSLLGVPIALGGAFFFALILAIAGLSGRKTPQAGESAPSYIFGLSTIGLAVVLYLAYASLFVLKSVCLLCVVTYVSVIAIFLISAGAKSFPMATLPSRAGRDLKTLISSPAALLIAALFAVGAVTAKETFPTEQAQSSQETAVPAQPVLPALTTEQLEQLERWWDVQPKVDLPISSEGAKVLMVKFNDFQCPPCRQSYEAYSALIAKWTAAGQFKFVLKHFPLEPECNGAIPNVVHPAACEAAAAVVMARRQSNESADKLEHWLFSHQGPPLLTPDQVKDAARDVAGITDFATRYDSALLEVRNDAGMGAMLGVKSTPTFFINGRILTGSQDPRIIDGVIALELKRAK